MITIEQRRKCLYKTVEVGKTTMVSFSNIGSFEIGVYENGELQTDRISVGFGEQFIGFLDVKSNSDCGEYVTGDLRIENIGKQITNVRMNKREIAFRGLIIYFIMSGFYHIKNYITKGE